MLPDRVDHFNHLLELWHSIRGLVAAYGEGILIEKAPIVEHFKVHKTELSGFLISDLRNCAANTTDKEILDHAIMLVRVNSLRTIEPNESNFKYREFLKIDV